MTAPRSRRRRMTSAALFPLPLLLSARGDCGAATEKGQMRVLALAGGEIGVVVVVGGGCGARCCHRGC